MSGTRLALRPSWFLAALILGLHAAAAACAVLSLPGWPGPALGAALALLGVPVAWGRALLRSPGSPRALVLGDRVTLERRNGEIFNAERRPGGHVSRLLVTLPMERTTVLVTRDMLAEEEFRRLRLWALWGRLPRRSVAAVQL